MLHPRYALRSRRTGGFFTPVALASAAALFAAFGIVGVAAVQTGMDAPIRFSWAPDVRDGKSRAATPKNGFVGLLSDGREVHVDRICQPVGSGVECWKPDGTPIRDARSAKIPLNRQATHGRTIVTSFTSTATEAEGSLGSASGGATSGTMRPSVIVFSGGGSARVGDHFEAYSFVEFPKEDSDTASFTLSVSDVVWENAATLPATPGSLASTGMIRTPTLAFPASADVPNAEGTKTTAETGLLRLSFWLEKDDALRTFRAFAVGESGREVAPIHEEGAYHGRRYEHVYYFRAKPTEVRSIQLDSYGARHLELVDLRIKPNR